MDPECTLLLVVVTLLYIFILKEVYEVIYTGKYK